MSTRRRLSCAAGLMAMAVSVCSAQSITSAHSGTLHYFDGDVSIDGTPVQAKVARFVEIKEQSVLSTGLGRAEVLLTPGVFLRIGENSSIRMLDNRLLSTRVEIISGDAILESDDPQMTVKNSPVTLLYKDYDIRMLRHGLIEITSNPAQMKVFKGEADVTGGSNTVKVNEGHLLPFSAALVAEKFNDKTGDDLYLWARDRSQDISAANMSSARSISDGFMSGSGYGYASPGTWNGGWYFNPYFNMFTFVPAGGVMWNPWGYGFFSPLSIYSYYSPGAYWGGGAVGHPVSTTVGGAAGLSSLRAASTGAPTALGSPVRSGGGLSAPSSGGGFSGGGVRGGGASMGGGGGHAGGGGGHGR